MFNLALRMLARDWRAGELRVLAIALVVAVASVTSVGFFADRVRQALISEAHQLLGADVVMLADRPWSDTVRREITARGLKLGENIGFVSMSRRGEEAQLSSVKAVSDSYPLRGKLRIADALNSPDREMSQGPRKGEVWPDERLAGALGVKVGDALELGESKLRVGAILTLEPDRGASFFNVAPRLMMNVADVPATGLVQTGSRITYSLLGAGEAEAVRGFEAWAKGRLGRGESIQSLENARPEIRTTLDRAQQFIGLTAMLAVVLAAVAVALATRRYSERHLDGYAVMRCFGSSHRTLFALFGWEFLLLGLAASAAGCIAGFAAQYVIGMFIAGLLTVPLPAPSLLPFVQGVSIGLALLLGFALPPLLQLARVPALRVLRREVGGASALSRIQVLSAYLLGLVVVGALLIWQAGDTKLGLFVLGGFLAAMIVFAVVTRGALAALGRISGGGNAAGGGRSAGALGWRYGVACLRRRTASTVVQVLAIALGLTAILMLSFTRGDLLDTWRGKTPADAPNRFLVNIQPEQRKPLLEFFRENRQPEPAMYPMVRGRFTAKNGQKVDAGAFEERDRRMVEREFNLSFMSVEPSHNATVAGRWFNADDFDKGGLSVEEGVAKRLGWKLGDTLTWQVAGRDFSATIVGIRKLDWDSMRVNFFVIATPKLLSEAPMSLITSFRLESSEAGFGSKVSQRFPNLTVVDMSAILRQALAVMEQVIGAVQFVFLFAIGAGILVLYAALLATQGERALEAAVMRALGASRSQVMGAQRAEFALIGLLAGLLAAAGATGIGWVIALKVFQFPYQMNPWVWLAGPLLGLLCVSWNAYSGARAALSRPPVVALREAT